MVLTAGFREAAPFAAMVAVEWGEVGMVTLAKAAFNSGMSTFVYLVYYNSLGVILLFPFFLFRTYYRKKRPHLTSALLVRFFILGLFGRALLMFGYLGIRYSSPALAAALANLIPVFTFLLAIIFGMERLDMRSSSSIAKSFGTLVAVFGAFVETLYKGPPIISGTAHSDLHSQDLRPQGSNWALGGLLLAIAFLSIATWNILQAATVKQYPEKVTVVFFFTLFGTMQCAIVSSIVERNPSAWTLNPGIAMIAIVYSFFDCMLGAAVTDYVHFKKSKPALKLFKATFGIVLRYNIVTWCLLEKGPLFVAMFKPLGMVIAVIAGMVFFGDNLHLGSVIGAMVIALGFYTVMWGQAKERTWSQTVPLEDWKHRDDM